MDDLQKADFPNGEVTNYIYSSENQLKSFKVVENGVLKKEVTYLYDALGRRVAKNVRDLTAESDPIKTFNRRYVYDGQEILLEYNGNNQLLARYTHSGLRTDDVLAADVTSDGVSAGLAQNTGSYQYLKDAQGTVNDIADNSGNKLQQYVYSAFGELLGIKDAYGADVSAAPPVRTSYSYTGREYDSESGMLYYRARYYLPEIGRFLQKDPEPGKLNIAASMVNGYAYVANNPINLADPSGRSFFSTIGALALSVVVTAALPALLLASVVISLVDPALGLSLGAASLNLSIPGQFINVLGTGKLAELHGFNGVPYIKNSVLPEIVGRKAFSLGAAAFIDSEHSDDPGTLMHEYGHSLQYEAWGGWEYITTGAVNKGEANWFEMDADARATRYFGVPICDYKDPNHPIPACRH